ncbi:MAG: cohesin domain-containing protein [Candidatus Nealsonbacteria bacterium]
MNKAFFIFTVLILSFGVAPAAEAAAASLYLSPSMGTYTVGNTFLVQAKVSTGGAAINAADGTLVFNANDLEVVKITKEESVFSLWVQDPVFSNSLGTINFAGGKPSPGFTGASGTIINITFKVKTSGTTNLTFASGSVLADDGMGTNILASMGSGVYTLSTKGIAPVVPSTPTTPTAPSATPNRVPNAPVISSLTHSEENQWYSNNDPSFSWELPSDVTGVSLLLHEKATANPGSDSDGLITSKTYENIADGAWYFHIRFRNQYGWGEITHRKVLIDTQKPEFFEVQVDNEGDPTNPSPILHFKSSDASSGIEYYEINIRETSLPLATAASLKHNPYKISPQAPGTFTVIAKAFDGAGNFTMASVDTVIAPLETPIITEYPQKLKVGDILNIKGTSAFPESTIKVLIKREGGETITKIVETDSQGNWFYLHPATLDKGDYEIWAIAVDGRGAQSNSTEHIKLAVTLPIVLKFGKIALDYLSIMITLIVLIIGAIAVGFYAWYRIAIWRKRVRQETKEVKETVTRAFKALKEEVEEQIEFLDEKPGLTKAERKVREKLKEALNVSEDFITEEIKDVEKELE